MARRIGDLRVALLRLAWDEAERPETEDEAVEFADAAEAFAWRRPDIEGVIGLPGARFQRHADELDWRSSA